MFLMFSLAHRQEGALHASKIYSRIIGSNVPVALLQDTVANDALTLLKLFILLSVTPFLKQTKSANHCRH